MRCNEPHLSFISEIRRKGQSPETDIELRTTLHGLTCPEYEDCFLRAGFESDDGIRAFSTSECNEKLSFFIDRLYETRGNARHWIEDSTSPEVFSRNLQEYESTLKKLVSLEPFYDFYSPTPSEELQQYYSEMEQLQSSFLGRWWSATSRNVGKLKTIESRKENLNQSFKELEKYKLQMAGTVLAEMEHLKSIPPEQVQCPPPKELRPFGPEDAAEEKEIVSEYNCAGRETSRHFARIRLIDLYYKFRHIEEYREKCIAVCKEDIANLPLLDAEEQLRQKQLAESSGIPEKESENRGFVGRISAFEKMIMICQNSKNYSEALKYCNMALAHYESRGIKEANIEKKKERILKLMEKQV